jgi:hypothetical protein
MMPGLTPKTLKEKDMTKETKKIVEHIKNKKNSNKGRGRKERDKMENF